MPIRRGIAFVDVPRNDDQADEDTHKTCFVRFRLARFATDFMEQPDVKDLGEITLLDGDEEKEYWEKNIFRGPRERNSNSGSGNRSRSNRRFNNNKSSSRPFKGRSFRPRTNNNFYKKGGSNNNNNNNNNDN